MLENDVKTLACNYTTASLAYTMFANAVQVENT